MGISVAECVKPVNPGFETSVDRVCFSEIEVDGIRIKIGIIYFNKIENDYIKFIKFIKIFYNYDLVIVHVPNDSVVGSSLAELLRMQGIIVESGKPTISSSKRVSVFTVKRNIGDNDIDKILVNIARELNGKVMKFVSGKRALYMGKALLFYPLKCYQMIMRGSPGEGTLSAEEVEACFELGTGSLVRFSESKGLKIDIRLGQIGELEDEAVKVLEFVGGHGEVSFDEIAEIVGSSEKAEVVIQILVDYGLLEPLGLDTYTIARLPLGRSHGLWGLLKERGLLVEGSPSECGIVLEPGISVERLDRIVNVFGVVKNEAIVYYPVYLGVFVKKKGEKKSEEIAVLVDGVVGKRLEDLEEIVVSSRIVYVIDDIIDKIVKKELKEIICREND